MGYTEDTEETRSPAPVAHTAAGALRGTSTGPDGRIAAFLGVPFMAPPVGALRFASPRPHPPWTGTRQALDPPPAFLQRRRLSPVTAPAPVPATAEDAGYANVWTPDLHGRRPVLVYLHGGGWEVGGGSSPTLDGTRLAARGDLVVVTGNYRLGPLGFGRHEQLADPDTGRCANWGLQDQIALVEWVRSTVAGFGGDPENITLCGTSAGGSSVWQLALLPRLRGAIRRIVPISAGHVWAPAYCLDPDDARTAFDALADRLGVDVPGLRTVDAGKLLAAWEDYFAATPDGHPVPSGRCYRGPVIDGDLMPAYDVHRPVPDLPVLCVVTATEGSFHTAGVHPPPADGSALRSVVHAHLRKGRPGVSRDVAEEAVRYYRALAREEGRPSDPFSLYTEIVGDSLFRHQVVRLAERGARESEAPRYLLHFAYPVRPPGIGTPHEATAPFLFGTHGTEHHRRTFGDGPLERRVSATLVDLVASFARDGVPRSRLAPDWHRFTPDRADVMCLGEPAGPRVGALPKADQLRFWDTAGWHPRT
ncbi:MULTISPECIES: carboxylesterase family protein [unclassified Streptomyces]|uniref:carboxylesterase family protein n=1 Tax=unclassified Streptomyces TaxID=2593676 RepID=UPI0035DBA563